MPSPELTNICTDSVVKAVKIKSSFSINPQKHVPTQEPKRPDFITVFMGCMELQFFGGIWGWGGEYSPTLSLGKKWKTKLVGENYSCVRKRKELQDNRMANVIKTS